MRSGDVPSSGRMKFERLIFGSSLNACAEKHHRQHPVSTGFGRGPLVEAGDVGGPAVVFAEDHGVVNEHDHCCVLGLVEPDLPGRCTSADSGRERKYTGMPRPRARGCRESLIRWS